MRINRYTVKLVKEGSLNYSLEEAIISPVVARDVIEKVFNLSSYPVEKFGIMTLNTRCQGDGVIDNSLQPRIT